MLKSNSTTENNNRRYSNTFGSSMPGYSYKADSADGYRFGFNGQEHEKDGLRDCYSFEFRIQDSRLGRFLSVDRLSGKFPYEGNYNYVSNSPLVYIDIDGRSRYKVINVYDSYGHYLGEIKILINTKDLLYTGKTGENSDGLGGSRISMHKWNDVHDVYKMTVNSDGTYSESLVSSNTVGTLRAETLFKWKWAAKTFILDKTEQEEKMDEWGFVGIRFTSGDGADGIDYGSEKNIYIRSQNIDMMMAAIGMSVSAGAAKGVGGATKNVPEIINQINELFSRWNELGEGTEVISDQIVKMYNCYQNLRDCRVEQNELELKYPTGTVYQCELCQLYYKISESHLDDSGFGYHHGNAITPSSLERLKAPKWNPTKIPDLKDCDKIYRDCIDSDTVGE